MWNGLKRSGSSEGLQRLWKPEMEKGCLNNTIPFSVGMCACMHPYTQSNLCYHFICYSLKTATKLVTVSFALFGIYWITAANYHGQRLDVYVACCLRAHPLVCSGTHASSGCQQRLGSARATDCHGAILIRTFLSILIKS